MEKQRKNHGKIQLSLTQGWLRSRDPLRPTGSTGRAGRSPGGFAAAQPGSLGAARLGRGRTAFGATGLHRLGFWDFLGLGLRLVNGGWGKRWEESFSRKLRIFLLTAL